MKNGPYTLIIAPEGYPGKKYRGRYAYEHHFVWWKYRGVVPGSGFEIHHRNGDHRDNRMANLELVSSARHKEIHAAEKRKEPLERPCKECSVVFSHRKSRKMFCSRSCAGTFNQRVRFPG